MTMMMECMNRIKKAHHVLYKLLEGLALLIQPLAQILNLHIGSCIYTYTTIIRSIHLVIVLSFFTNPT